MELSLHPVNLLVYGQGSGFEVQVVPLEGQQFAPPQAGTQIQEKQLVIALCLRLDEEAPGFLLHRFLQRGPADGVEAARHGVGEHLAELFRADGPPSRSHPGIELLEVLLGQLVQRDLPQLREDVLIDLRFVVHLGGGADLGLDVVLIPEVQPLPEGRLRPDLFCPGGGRRLPELPQFLPALPFRLSQDILRFGQAFLDVTDDHPALPAAVLALVDGTLALFSPFSHGVHLLPACFSAAVSVLSSGDFPGSRL